MTANDIGVFLLLIAGLSALVAVVSLIPRISSMINQDWPGYSQKEKTSIIITGGWLSLLFPKSKNPSRQTRLVRSVWIFNFSATVAITFGIVGFILINLKPYESRDSIQDKTLKEIRGQSNLVQ